MKNKVFLFRQLKMIEMFGDKVREIVEDEINFEVFLNQLGYPYWDETDNPAYKLFLG